MSKLAVAGASAGVLGTGGVATIAAHQMGAFGGGPIDPTYLASTLDGFHKQNGGSCLDKTFPGIPNAEKLNNKNSNIEDAGNSPKLLGGDKNTDSIGCLIVNWDKTLGSNNSLNGNFRLLWTLARGDAGFAVYLNGDFDSSNASAPKMTFGGRAYTFEQAGKIWKVSKKLDMKTKTLSGADIKKYFPKTKSSSPTAFKGLNAWWNFLDDSQNKVKDTEIKNYRGQWWWDKYTTGSIVQEIVRSWSQNMSEWWKHLFDSGSKWNMQTLTGDVIGFWKTMTAEELLDNKQ